MPYCSYVLARLPETGIGKRTKYSTSGKLTSSPVNAPINDTSRLSKQVTNASLNRRIPMAVSTPNSYILSCVIIKTVPKIPNPTIRYRTPRMMEVVAIFRGWPGQVQASSPASPAPRMFYLPACRSDRQGFYQRCLYHQLQWHKK